MDRFASNEFLCPSRHGQTYSGLLCNQKAEVKPDGRLKVLLYVAHLVALDQDGNRVGQCSPRDESYPIRLVCKQDVVSQTYFRWNLQQLDIALQDLHRLNWDQEYCHRLFDRRVTVKCNVSRQETFWNLVWPNPPRPLPSFAELGRLAARKPINPFLLDLPVDPAPQQRRPSKRKGARYR